MCSANGITSGWRSFPGFTRKSKKTALSCISLSTSSSVAKLKKVVRMDHKHLNTPFSDLSKPNFSMIGSWKGKHSSRLHFCSLVLSPFAAAQLAANLVWKFLSRKAWIKSSCKAMDCSRVKTCSTDFWQSFAVFVRSSCIRSCRSLKLLDACPKLLRYSLSIASAICFHQRPWDRTFSRPSACKAEPGTEIHTDSTVFCGSWQVNGVNVPAGVAPTAAPYIDLKTRSWQKDLGWSGESADVSADLPPAGRNMMMKRFCCFILKQPACDQLQRDAKGRESLARSRHKIAMVWDGWRLMMFVSSAWYVSTPPAALKKKDHLKQIPGAMRSSRAAHLHGVASNGAPICWVRSSDPSSLAVYGFKAVDLGEKIQVIDDDQWSMWKQVIDQTWLGNDGKIQ